MAMTHCIQGKSRVQRSASLSDLELLDEAIDLALTVEKESDLGEISLGSYGESEVKRRVVVGGGGGREHISKSSQVVGGGKGNGGLMPMIIPGRGDHGTGRGSAGRLSGGKGSVEHMGSDKYREKSGPPLNPILIPGIDRGRGKNSILVGDKDRKKSGPTLKPIVIGGGRKKGVVGSKQRKDGISMMPIVIPGGGKWGRRPTKVPDSDEDEEEEEDEGEEDETIHGKPIVSGKGGGGQATSKRPGSRGGGFPIIAGGFGKGKGTSKKEESEEKDEEEEDEGRRRPGGAVVIGGGKGKGITSKPGRGSSGGM